MLENKGSSMLTIPCSVQTAEIRALKLALINTLGLQTLTGESPASRSAILNAGTQETSCCDWTLEHLQQGLKIAHNPS